MKMREIVLSYVVVMLLFVFSLLPYLSAEINSSGSVSTNLNIPNVPPILIKIIPNQSWSANSNLENAFDLDDYFTDPVDEISYSYSNVENITIVISNISNSATNSSHIVSFYSDVGFLGIRNVTFYASDPGGTTPSNLVFLFVENDTEPPTWSLPRKSKTKIYQNNYVNFTTLWEDNFQLYGYNFYADQGSGWYYYPFQNFSGTQNTSIYQIQISASAGTMVYWKFCAYDTSWNMNCTDSQSFNVSARNVTSSPSSPPPTTGAVSSSSSNAATKAVELFEREKKTESFTVFPDSFKITLKQGSTETRVLKITNTGNTELSFNLSVEGIEDFVLFGNPSFILDSGESKEVVIDFSAKYDSSSEQYFGKILVNSSNDFLDVPVVIDVKALKFEYGVDVLIPDEYKMVKPGEKVLANISLTNLLDSSNSEVILYTALKDFYGNIYDSSEEPFNLTSDMKLLRSLTVPRDTQYGNYIFYARVSNDDGVAIGSDVFQVASGFSLASAISSSFIFILILFLSVLAWILALRYNKEKQKEKILGLYLMLNELKNAIKENDTEKALELYIRVKAAYGEPVSKSVKENKEDLKEEIKKLSAKLREDIHLIKKDVDSTKVKTVSDKKNNPDKKSSEKNMPEKKILDKNSVQKNNPDKKNSEKNMPEKKILDKNSVQKNNPDKKNSEKNMPEKKAFNLQDKAANNLDSESSGNKTSSENLTDKVPNDKNEQNVLKNKK